MPSCCCCRSWREQSLHFRPQCPGEKGRVWTGLDEWASLPGLNQTPRNSPGRPCWPVRPPASCCVSGLLPPWRFAFLLFPNRSFRHVRSLRGFQKMFLCLRQQEATAVAWIQELWIIGGRKLECSKKKVGLLFGGLFVFTFWYSHFLNLGSLWPSRTPWSNCFKEWMRLIHKKYTHDI